MRRARGRGLAVAIALALHAGLLAVLAIEPREPRLAETPVMQVTLAPPLRLPKALQPRRPVRRPALHHPVLLPPPDIAPTPAPSVATAPTVDQRWRLEAAPFGGEEQVFRAIRRRQRCFDGDRLTDWERSKCPAVKPPGPGEPTYAVKDTGGAFAAAAAGKAKQRVYRETTSDQTYPGLHCLFGHKC